MQRARTMVVAVVVAGLALSVGLGVASATPTADGSATTQADSDGANVTLFVAPGSDLAAMRGADTVSEYDDVRLTARPFITVRDTLVVRVHAPGLGGAVGARPGNTTTAQFFSLLDSDRARLTVEEAFTDDETTPRVFSITDPALTSVARVDSDTYQLAVNLSAVETTEDDNGNGLPDDGDLEPLGSGDVYEFDFQFDDYRANSSALVFPVAVDFRTDGSGNISELAPKPGQRVTGRTTLAPGTELTVELTGTGAEPFRRTQTVVPTGVERAEFTAVFDLVGVPDGTPALVIVKHDGTNIGKAETRISELVGSLSVPEQVSTTDRLAVTRVNLSQSGFLVVRAGGPSGPIVGNRYLGGGAYNDLTVQFSQPVKADSLHVSIYVDIDEDQVFDRDGIDQPYRRDGEPVSAVVDVAGNSGTPALTTLPPSTTSEPRTQNPTTPTSVTTTPLITPPPSTDTTSQSRVGTTQTANTTGFTPYTITAANGPGFGAGLALAVLVTLGGLLARRQ